MIEVAASREDDVAVVPLLYTSNGDEASVPPEL
jgi:hypothetical protein